MNFKYLKLTQKENSPVCTEGGGEKKYKRKKEKGTPAALHLQAQWLHIPHFDLSGPNRSTERKKTKLSTCYIQLPHTSEVGGWPVSKGRWANQLRNRVAVPRRVCETKGKLKYCLRVASFSPHSSISRLATMCLFTRATLRAGLGTVPRSDVFLRTALAFCVCQFLQVYTPVPLLWEICPWTPSFHTAKQQLRGWIFFFLLLLF